ncbi:MAG: DNA-binding protein WhiA [Firmicutes bacterium]|nr:DNA-binding protein WhiA [Bacillota bacterium]
MSFSEETRNELARVIPTARCCRLAELSALYELDGFLLGKNNQYLDFNNSSPLVARKILLLVQGLYPQLPTQVLFIRSRTRRAQRYTVRVLGSSAAEQVYGDFKKQKMDQERPILRKKCCRRAFLRGAFLSRGSVTNPEKTYHLEISTEQSSLAYKILETMDSLTIRAGLIQRKGSFLAYLKDGQQIVNFLNLVGADTALLKFENVRVLKEMRNQINRLVNCETANVDKTITAALTQLEDIRLIENRIGLEQLPPKLRMVAELRVQNPYASLQELANLMAPKMSKSGVNYRLRQIRAKAEQLKNLNPKF